MDIVVGNVVKGENLYGREPEIRQLWETVEKSSLLMMSPRRYGKTSIVLAMKDNPRQGWSVTYIDMEGHGEPWEFITEMLYHFEPNVLDKIKNLFHSVRDATSRFKILSAIEIELRESNNNWKEAGTRIFHKLIDDNLRPIVIIDELPTYLDKIQKKYQDDGATISTFLHWLRKMRQDLQIRFIICGSIGIQSIVDRYELYNSVNDLHKVRLGAFDNKTAIGMITAILDRYNIRHAEDKVQEIMSQIGLQVPFFLQLMLKEIQHRTNFGKDGLTSEIISDSYKRGLLGVEGKKDFEWYFKRLRTEFVGKDYLVAVRILEHLTQVSSATETDLENVYMQIKKKENKPEFKKILDVLESGYYIRVDRDDNIMFHNKVLRDLWIQEGGIR